MVAIVEDIHLGRLKIKLRELALAPVAAAMMAFVTPATANTLTYQGVTFATLSSANTLTLIITNALSGGTGNWANINFLNAFEIKGVGEVTGATLAGWSTTVINGISANTLSGSGCTTGGTPGACFFRDSTLGQSAIALSDLMTFDINFTGTNLDFSAPHLKVQFFELASQTQATGSLLSKSISPVPEPEIYAMMAVGLGLLGWAVRRRKPTEVVAD